MFNAEKKKTLRTHNKVQQEMFFTKLSENAENNLSTIPSNLLKWLDLYAHSKGGRLGT